MSDDGLERLTEDITAEQFDRLARMTIMDVLGWVRENVDRNAVGVSGIEAIGVGTDEPVEYHVRYYVEVDA